MDQRTPGRVSVRWPGDEVMSAVTAEVAQRRLEGRWRYLIDHPYAGLEAAEAGNLAEVGATPSS